MPFPAITTVRLPMSARLRDGLAGALDEGYPELAVRLDEAQLFELEQPFFGAHRIIEVQAATQMPALGGFVALASDGSVTLLTRRLQAINTIARRERPRIADDEWARAYGIKVDEWARDGEWPAMVLDDFRELFFRTRLDDRQRERVAALTDDLAGVIEPLRFSRTEQGWRLEMWALSNCQLLERRLEISSQGLVERHDLVRAADIPVYEGLMWGERNGVMVPIE